MSVEFTDKRFGVIAIEKGFITMDQLVKTLTIQIEEEIESGMHRIIGAILVEKGYLNLSQVEEILECM